MVCGSPKGKHTPIIIILVIIIVTTREGTISGEIVLACVGCRGPYLNYGLEPPQKNFH